MAATEYRLESNDPIAGRLLPGPGANRYYFRDRSLAVAMAAKSTTPGGEIRVVHVPTGEIVFRKAGSATGLGETDVD